MVPLRHPARCSGIQAGGIGSSFSGLGTVVVRLLSLPFVVLFAASGSRMMENTWLQGAIGAPRSMIPRQALKLGEFWVLLSLLYVLWPAWVELGSTYLLAEVVWW